MVHFCILLTQKGEEGLLEFCFHLTFLAIVCCKAKIKQPEPEPKPLMPWQQALTTKLQGRWGTGCSQFPAVPPHCENTTAVTFRRQDMTLRCFSHSAGALGLLNRFGFLLELSHSLPSPCPARPCSKLNQQKTNSMHKMNNLLPI